jgi:hypothetical protein
MTTIEKGIAIKKLIKENPTCPFKWREWAG